MKPREEVQKEILEIVNRETRAWNAKDADLLITVFHPALVWPWPPNSDTHDPMKWLLVLGRFDAACWKKVWRDLFDSHPLIHNRRAIRKIEVSDQGDGAFAVVGVDALWRDSDGQDFHWKGRACKVCSRPGAEWKMTTPTRLLAYEPSAI
jgi:ketosteroid isomerase-like protein